MADSTVSALGASSALGGTELFYSDNGSSDVKVTANQIKVFVSDSGAGGSTTQIQYNSSGAFAGDSNLTWDATDGLINKKHLGLGSSAVLPGNIEDGVLVIRETWTGDLGALAGGFGLGAGISMFINFEHTGTGATAQCQGIDNVTSVGANSTHAYSEFWAQQNQTATSVGSTGAIPLFGGIQADIFHLGNQAITQGECYAGLWHMGKVGGGASGTATGMRSFSSGGEMRGGTTVTEAIGYFVGAYDNNDGANTITNNYGIKIADQTAPTIIAGSLTFTTRNWNFYSQGNTSTNVFEGNLTLGNDQVATAITFSQGVTMTGADFLTAGTMAIHDFSSATTFRVYRTVTDQSNFTRATYGWRTTTNVLTIGTEKAGSGSSLPFQFIYGGTVVGDYGVTTASQWTFTGPVAVSGALTHTGVTVANLPASPVAGMVAYVTDSNTVTWGATIAGLSSNKVLAFYNGTNWTVAGK